MEIKIKDTAQEAALYLATILIEQMKSKPDSVLGFATGRTMDAVYFNLMKEYQKDPFDVSQIKAFILDEYIGLKKGSPDSYRFYMDFHLFNPIGFKEENIFTPNVHSSNLEQSCLDYENKIKELGGVDLQIMGVGLNGHIGFNEPGSSVDSRTRVVALTTSTRVTNQGLFEEEEEVPLTAITMGIGTIHDAKKCYLLATGETKKEIIKEFVESEINSQIPATLLKDHQDFTVILDQYASKLLDP